MATGFIPDQKNWNFKTKVYKAAIRYTAKPWSVFPCFSAKQLPSKAWRCTCGRPKCTRPAKHPATKNGLKDATNDHRKLEGLKAGNDQNIAIRTGDGLLVVDIDGDIGAETISALQEEYEPLPETLTCITGGQGIHYYFKVSKEIRCSAKKLGKGVDIRGDGGYVIAPPSRHISGRQYFWDDGQPYELAEAPWWVVDLATETSKTDLDQDKPDKVIKGGRDTYLTSLAGTMRRRGFGSEAIYSALEKENQDRCDPPMAEREVRKIARSIGNKVPGDDAGTWRALLKKNKDGHPHASPTNAAILLNNTDVWKGVIRYDEFADTISWIGEPPEGPFAPNKGDEFDMESDPLYVAHWLSKKYGPLFKPEDCMRAVKLLARESKVHPLRDYLLGLKWDKKSRIDTWLHDYLGAPLGGPIGKWFLIASVARALRPGCKADNVMVLEGSQGTYKSTAIATLCPERKWFSDSLPRLDDKYIGMYLQGRWIIEIGELTSLRGVSKEKIKLFMTQQQDTYKRPYDKQLRERPRSCMFVGSTNLSEYLTDDENRRFWPVPCGDIDIPGLSRSRDQLWAEAVHMFDAGERWYPTQQEQKELNSEQMKRVATNPVWEEKLYSFVMARGMGPRAFISTAELVAQVGIPAERAEHKHTMEVGKIMMKFGWRKGQRTTGNRRLRGWKKTGDS